MGERTQGRRLQVADAMIAIAFTAIGIYFLKIYIQQISMKAYHPSLKSLMALERLSGGAVCLGGAWALALLVILLRQSRADRQPALRHPGAAACAAVSLVVLTNFLFLAIFALVRSASAPLLIDTGKLLFPAAMSTAASWLTLGACGLWRPESHWAGRAGRWLAYALMAITIYSKLAEVYLY